VSDELNLLWSRRVAGSRAVAARADYRSSTARLSQTVVECCRTRF